MNLDAPIVIVHPVGDPEGGRRWREALLHAGWRGTVLAPDLPGHAGTPPPVGGHHELADPAVHLVPLLAELGGPSLPVVVGVGANGWSAQLLALGGRASGLVLVDGLGAPWLGTDEAIAADVAELRAIADDTAAIAPAPGDGSLDPRLRHGPRPHGSRALAERAARATPVPTLVVESPSAATSADDLALLVAAYPAGGTVVEVAAAEPSLVAAAITAWASASG